MATVNWTRTGFMGITASGWEIRHNREIGKRDWLVFDADGVLIGKFDTRADAVKAAR
jgi:hypothetical protein